MSALRWLTTLTESLSRARGEADAVLVELAQRIGERLTFPMRAAARFEGTTLRCLLAAGDAPFGAGAVVGDSEIVRFYGEGTLDRLKGVRIARNGDRVRVVVELRGQHRRVGAVFLGRDTPLDGEEIDLIVAAARVGELAASSPSVPAPSSLERTAEHWEAIGRLTSTVLHELGNPVAFAALAASQLARASGNDPAQSKALAEDLALSVKQMAELLAELRRVSRGPEGASFVEPRAIVEGAVRLAHAELRGVATIEVDVDELPLVPGRVGTLGAGLAHLFATVLRGSGGTLSVKGGVNEATKEVTLLIEGFDFRMPRALDPVRIVRGIAVSGDGRAELRRDGGLEIFLPTVRESPPSSKRLTDRPRLLVVEDEVALGRALAAALGTAFEVVVARSVEEALDCVDQGTFEAVLCDVHLAGESGLQLYEKIVRRAPALANRFALTSGGMDGETEARAKARGLPILAKPFDWPVLERELARLVSEDAIT